MALCSQNLVAGSLLQYSAAKHAADIFTNLQPHGYPVFSTLRWAGNPALSGLHTPHGGPENRVPAFADSRLWQMWPYHKRVIHEPHPRQPDSAPRCPARLSNTGPKATRAQEPGSHAISTAALGPLARLPGNISPETTEARALYLLLPPATTPRFAETLPP